MKRRNKRMNQSRKQKTKKLIRKKKTNVKKKKKDKRQKERRWLNQKERKECCNGVFMSKMQERFCSQFSFIFFSSISTCFQLLSFFFFSFFSFFFFGGASRNSNEIITFRSCEICREKILEKERERKKCLIFDKWLFISYQKLQDSLF